jgi:hypothetical protein
MKTVVPLAASQEEALEAFRQLVTGGVTDARDEWVEVDFGDYAHVIHQEDRLRQIPWIAPTLQSPDQIIRLPLDIKGGHLKQVEDYIRRIYLSDDDEEGTLFLVGVERTVWGLRLRTWFAPRRQEEYVEDLGGDVIWTPKKPS